MNVSVLRELSRTVCCSTFEITKYAWPMHGLLRYDEESRPSVAI